MPDNLNYSSGTVVTYFARLDVAPSGTRREVSDVTTPGVDGHAFRAEALRAPEFPAESLVYVASFALADSLRILYEALQANLVLVNAKGLAYADVIIKDVKVMQFKRVAMAYYVILPDGSVDTGPAVEVRASWLLQYAGAPS